MTRGIEFSLLPKVFPLSRFRFRLTLTYHVINRSHIIPRTIGAWIKATSISGYLSSGLNPSKREQDIVKVRMLCKNCDGKFSKYENAFMQNFFRPYQIGLRHLEYSGDWLYNFTLFTLMKIVYFEKEFKGEYDDCSLIPKSTLDVLLSILSGDIPLEIRVAFLKDLETTKLYHILKSGLIIRERYLIGNKHQYMTRAVDFGMPFFYSTRMVYFVVPGMIFYWIYDNAGEIHEKGQKINPYGGTILANNATIIDTDILKILEFFAEESLSHIERNMRPERKIMIDQIRQANRHLLF